MKCILFSLYLYFHDIAFVFLCCGHKIKIKECKLTLFHSLELSTCAAVVMKHIIYDPFATNNTQYDKVYAVTNVSIFHISFAQLFSNSRAAFC